ncbi:tyrosine-type recombinase/integrase [Calidifontibacillus oryziterrae]|uniref:tyrosine-type recombinase/integrase n=1 Tax=Calidifontibacillus oryziterrae TaxID=1191699 RepID=UPI0002D3D214|nr:tyrosine-type recombinase/integrase [Calidifontibacillus oryziterrae]
MKRMRTTNVTNTLHHPLDYYFSIFIRAKQVEGLKSRTLKDHESHYKYFKLWLVERYPTLKLEELTADHVRQYLHYMLNERTQYKNHPTLEKHSHKQGLSPATVNIRTRTLKCFLKFLFDEGHMQENLAKRMKLQKVDEDTIGAFTKEEMLLLLSQPNQREYTGFRDYVLMTLLLDTGMRINEVLQMQVNHIDYNKLLIQIPASHSKNGKARTVPITRKTSELIKTLVDENKQQFNKVIPFVFLLNNGEPLTYHQAYSQIKVYGERAGITSARVSPHTFRHTFAKHFIMNGGDVFTLQKILGHANIQMCRKYVQMTEKDLTDTHEQTSPVAQY